MISWLLIVLALLFLILITDDLVPLGKWNNLAHARSQVPKWKLSLALTMNAMLGVVRLVLTYPSRQAEGITARQKA